MVSNFFLYSLFKSLRKPSNVFLADCNNSPKLFLPGKFAKASIPLFSKLLRDINKLLRNRLIFKFIPYGRKGADCLFEFLSNDERLAAESILRLYSKRWRLENAFAELKNELHIDKVPGSSFAKINAHIALTLLAYNLSVCLKSRIAKLAKVRIATLRLKLINIQAALKQAAGLVYVDAVFKEHRHEVASDADPWRLTTS